MPQMTALRKQDFSDTPSRVPKTSLTPGWGPEAGSPGGDGCNRFCRPSVPHTHVSESTFSLGPGCRNRATAGAPHGCSATAGEFRMQDAHAEHIVVGAVSEQCVAGRAFAAEA